MRERLITLGLAVILTLGLNLGAWAIDATSPLIPYTKAVLDNGLTVIVKEIHTVPIAAVNVWVGTGSINETKEIAGLSHFFEHMAFKGTTTRPVGQIMKEVQYLGGSLNAGTSYDTTNFYIVIPSEHIDKAIEIQADSIMNSVYDQTEIDRERNVILEEMRLRDSNPSVAAIDAAFAKVFEGTPYASNVIGTAESLANCDHDQFISYKSQWYVPNNMVVVITGDVDTEKVIEKVKGLFGTMKPVALPPVHPFEIPVGKAAERLDVEKDVQMAYAMLSFPGPGKSSDDEPVLSVAGVILGGGMSSRLYSELLLKKNLVLDVSSSYSSLRDVGAFIVGSNLPPAALSEYESDVKAALRKLAEEPVSQAELDKAKMLVEASFTYASESNLNIAMLLGSDEIYGSAEDAVDYVQKLRAVTADDVLRVAKKYLNPDSAVFTVVKPKEAK